MIYNTIANLKSATIPSNNYASVLGYESPGDGGGGDFYWDFTDTVSADNGGTVFASSIDSNGRWKRLYCGAISVKWFGAKGDGITDDTAAIQLAVITASPLHKILDFQQDTYVVSQVLLQDNSSLQNGTLINLVQVSGQSILKGDTVQDISLENLVLGGIITSTTTPGYNVNNCGAYFNDSSNINIKNITVYGKASGIQVYRCFNINIDSCKIHHNINTGISGYANDTIVQSCIFDTNGRVAAGATHDLYLINSSNISVIKNIFRNHVDPTSYGLVGRYDETEYPEYEEMNGWVIDNNYIDGHGVYITTIAPTVDTKKPAYNVSFTNNQIIDGELAVQAVVNFKSSNNTMAEMVITNGSTWPGYRMTFTSEKDSMERIYAATIGAHFGFDVKNVLVIDPILRGDRDFLVNIESTFGGQPELSLIRPRIDNAAVTLLDTASTNRNNVGNLLVEKTQKELQYTTGNEPKYLTVGVQVFNTTLGKPFVLKSHNPDVFMEI